MIGRLTAVLLVVALALVGCTGEPADPRERLAEAMEDTFGGAFAYRLSAEADRAALASLGEQAGQAAAFLNTFAVSGMVDGDTMSVAVQVLVSDPIVEVRRFSDEELYVRLGLLDLPIRMEGTARLEEDLLAVVEQEDLPSSLRRGVVALFDGEWVGIVGPFDPDRLRDLGGGARTGTTATASPSPPMRGLPAFVRGFVDVEQEVTDDGMRRYDVDLRLRDLLRTLADVAGGTTGAADLEGLDDDLAELPERVPGRVDVSDGVVTSIRFDVAEAARALGRDVPGQIMLRFDVSEHGEAAPPDVPDQAVPVGSDDLSDGLVLLLSPLTG